MWRRKILIALLSLLSFYGCKDEDKCERILGFNNPKYINDFENRQILESDSIFESEFYFQDFSICDSFLFANSGSWNVINISNDNIVETLFSKGHAYGEFEQLPETYTSSFIHKEKELYVIVYDFGNGKVYETNISKTIASDSLFIKELNHKTKRALDRYLYIDTMEFVTRENTHENCPKKLTHYIDNKEVKNKYFDMLNEIDIKSNDHNALSALEGYNPKRALVVQAYIYFNVINIIPLDGKNKAITLCYGDKKISLNDIVDNLTREDFFYELRLYEDNFAVLCLKDLDKPTVQFYDYTGKPLMEYILSKPATSFDIDWKHHKLYTHNESDGTIVRYNIVD